MKQKSSREFESEHESEYLIKLPRHCKTWHEHCIEFYASKGSALCML
jgi:hypothetical protein